MPFAETAAQSATELTAICAIGEWGQPCALVTVSRNQSRNVEATVLNVWSRNVKATVLNVWCRRVEIPNIEIQEIQDNCVLNKTCCAADLRQVTVTVERGTQPSGYHSGVAASFGKKSPTFREVAVPSSSGCNNLGSLTLELLVQRQTRRYSTGHTGRGTGREIGRPAVRQPAQVWWSDTAVVDDFAVPHGSHDRYKSARVGRPGNRVPFPAEETRFLCYKVSGPSPGSLATDTTAFSAG